MKQPEWLLFVYKECWELGLSMKFFPSSFQAAAVFKKHRFFLVRIDLQYVAYLSIAIGRRLKSVLVALTPAHFSAEYMNSLSPVDFCF